MVCVKSQNLDWKLIFQKATAYFVFYVVVFDLPGTTDFIHDLTLCGFAISHFVSPVSWQEEYGRTDGVVEVEGGEITRTARVSRTTRKKARYEIPNPD